jgi:hypothetical protein
MSLVTHDVFAIAPNAFSVLPTAEEDTVVYLIVLVKTMMNKLLSEVF